MEEKEIKALVDEIRNKRLFSDDKITEFLDSESLDSSDKIKLFKEMASDHTFDYNFIQHHVLEVLSDDDEFIDLLLILADKIAYYSLGRLDQVYSRSPELAMTLYEKLCIIGGARIPAPITYLLTGIVKNNHEKFFQTIDFSSSDPYITIGQIEALRIASLTCKIPKLHIDKMISETDNSNDTIRFAALHFLLTANIDDKDASMKLVDLAKSASQDVKRYVARNSYILCKNKPDLALDLLSILSESDDPALLNEITQSLGSIAHKYPIECLRIVRRWSSKDELRNKIGLSWVPEQIGKGDAQSVESFLLEWVDEEENVLVIMFDLPTLLRDIYSKNDKKRLIDLLAKIQLKDDKRLAVLTKALEMILSEEYNKHPRNQEFVDKSYDFVCAVAQSRGIPHSLIEPRLNDKLMRTLAIVDSLDKPQRKVDFNVVKSNLKYCPNVISLLGQRWFDDKIGAQDSSQSTFILL